MPRIDIVLKAESFKYPTSEEKVEALKGYPKIELFHFTGNDILDNILNKQLPFKEVAREENLIHWNLCLNNRFGKLIESYIYLTTSYNRKFPDDEIKYTEEEAVNKVIFDYNAESFYYFFFSTRDVIAQVLNIYCCIDKPENGFYFDSKFIKEIKDSNIRIPLKVFNKETKVASSFRNAFTHRFSPTQRDYRAVISMVEGKEVLGVNGGKFVTSKEIFENINSSLKSLEKLMHELNKIIK